jgi:hypothetical protein
VVKLSTPKRKV